VWTCRGEVVAALPNHAALALPIHAVLLGRDHVPERVRIVIRHLAREFGRDPLLADVATPS